MSQSHDEHWLPGTVRVRAKATDLYEGLRGHAYIKARGLKTPVKRLDADNKASRFNFLFPSDDGENATNNQHRFRFLPELTVPEES